MVYFKISAALTRVTAGALCINSYPAEISAGYFLKNMLHFACMM